MRKILTAIATILALSACGGTAGSEGGGEYGSSGGSQTGAGAAAAPADAIKISLVDFKITPDSISTRPGEVSFAVSNDGKTSHNLTIFDTEMKVLAKTPEVAPGKTAVLKVKLAAGSYHVNCSVPGHERLGMAGMITAG